MSSNEENTEMKNDLQYGMQKQPEFKQAMMCCNCSFCYC